MSGVARARAETKYFCYLLTSCDPKYKNHTYVGFTINPKRRLRQHNGELTNGAKRTTRKRPWQMVATVYGFPTKTLALQFEWILQHPRDSKRFREIASNMKKIGNLYLLKAKLRFMLEMLHIPPFQSLPLTLHWFTEKYMDLIKDCPPLPPHIRANVGPMDGLANDDCVDSDENREVESDSENSDKEEGEREIEYEGVTMIRDSHSFTLKCYSCQMTLDKSIDSIARCVHAGCNMTSHLTCLSKDFLQSSPTSLLPTSGTCRGCNQPLHWGDIIKKMKTKSKKKAASEDARLPLHPIDTNVQKDKPTTKKAASKRKKETNIPSPDITAKPIKTKKQTKTKTVLTEKNNLNNFNNNSNIISNSTTTTSNINNRISTSIFTQTNNSTPLSSSNYSLSYNSHSHSSSHSSLSSLSSPPLPSLPSNYKTTQNKVDHNKQDRGFVIGQLDELYSSDESSSDVISSRGRPTYTKTKENNAVL